MENDRTIEVVAVTEGQTDFNYDFPVDDISELKALKPDLTEVSIASYVPGDNGGTVTLQDGVALGETIQIEGHTAIERNGEIPSGGLRSDYLNDEFNRMIRIFQEFPRKIFSSSLVNNFKSIVFALNQSITLKGTNENGFITPLIKLIPVTEYDRPAIVGYDHNGEIAWALYSHYLNSGNDAIHSAAELKTANHLGKMITRESMTYGSDASVKTFYAVERVNFASPDGEVFARLGTNNGTPQEIFVLHPDSNKSGAFSIASVMDFGFDEPGATGYLKAGSGKSIEFFTDDRSGDDWSLRIDSDGRTRFNKARRDMLVRYSQLSGLIGDDAPVEGDCAFLSDADPVQSQTFRAIVTKGGGTDGCPIHYDGTNWRYG